MKVLDNVKSVPEAAEWVRQERQKRGWTAQELANKICVVAAETGDEISLTQQAVSNFETGKTKTFPRWLRYFDLLLMIQAVADREAMAGAEESSVSDRQMSYDYGRAPARRDDEDLVEIAEVDASYGLGSTDISAPISAEMRTFSRAWLRTITRADPKFLFWAITQGDSMEPTIRSGELVLIDRSQDTLRERDQIWACTISDFGAIKRLRPLGDGSVAILSDNPNVPEDRAVDDELFIIGRVVARVGKL